MDTLSIIYLVEGHPFFIFRFHIQQFLLSAYKKGKLPRHFMVRLEEELHFPEEVKENSSIYTSSILPLLVKILALIFLFKVELWLVC